MPLALDVEAAQPSSRPGAVCACGQVVTADGKRFIGTSWRVWRWGLRTGQPIGKLGQVPFHVYKTLGRAGQTASSPSGDEESDDASREPPQLVVPTSSDSGTEFVPRVREAVEAHLVVPDLTMEALADEGAVSRSMLYCRLKVEAELTPIAFIRQVLVAHGACLLRVWKTRGVNLVAKWM